MAEPVVQLPPLAGGQADSWAALVELAPVLGDNWLLVGGQMVFLHEVERRSTDIRPTDDVGPAETLRASVVVVDDDGSFDIAVPVVSTLVVGAASPCRAIGELQRR